MAWICMLPALFAQNGELPHNKRISWLSYNADHPAGSRWSVHFDGSYRPMYGTVWRQWMVRPGANWRSGERWQLSLTYSYFSVHPKGLADPNGAAGEHRLHQQVEYSHPWRSNTIRHRFRLEERHLSSPWKEGVPRTWNWQDRPRYMLRMDRPLRRNGNQREPLTLTLYEEALFSFASPAASAFEQNRIYTGVTWRTGRHWAVDAGVLYQTFKPQNGGRLEHNFIFVTLLRNQAPLKNLFGWLRRL
ncbi:MAG: DUF2490 domain-containing protein [Acidobacteriota bacterium]